MSLADPRVALEQMRSHAEEAVALLRGKTLRDLHTDRTLSLAILRLLEIVGEAANRRRNRGSVWLCSSPHPP